MKSLHTPLTLRLSSLTMGVLTAQAQEELIFSERFTNLTGSGVSLIEYGFSGLILDPRHGDPTKPLDVSTIDGQPFASEVAIGQGGVELSFDENDEGVIYMWTGGKETWYLLMTEMAAIDRSEKELSRVTWYHSRSGGELGDFAVRIVLEIDGQYYATLEDYGETGEDVLDWKQKEYAFSTEGSVWTTLTANPEEDWNLGVEPLSGPLPDGDIEAVGFYVHRGVGGGSIWLDEVQIFAVEDSTGGGSTWNGFPVEDGYVDTGVGGWLNGFVFVGDAEDAGWVYVFSLGKYVYVTPAGWIYLNR